MNGLAGMEKSHIVLEHQTNIVERIHQRTHSLQAEAEGEARINLRVNIAGSQNIRVNHSRTAEFNPARTFARATAFVFKRAGAAAFETGKIKLRARLGEREVRRAQANARFLAEQTAQPFADRAFQVRHRDIFVHAQTFNLMKHRRVRQVGRVAAENSAGRDDANRHAASFHCANLHGRSLRAKRETVCRVESILRFTRRMTFGNIKRVEVIIIGFDFAVVFNRITHRNKNVLNLLAQNRQKM